MCVAENHGLFPAGGWAHFLLDIPSRMVNLVAKVLTKASKLSLVEEAFTEVALMRLHTGSGKKKRPLIVGKGSSSQLGG